MVLEKQVMSLQMTNMELSDQILAVKSRNQDTETALQDMTEKFLQMRSRLEKVEEYETAMDILKTQFPDTEFS